MSISLGFTTTNINWTKLKFKYSYDLVRLESVQPRCSRFLYSSNPLQTSEKQRDTNFLENTEQAISSSSLITFLLITISTLLYFNLNDGHLNIEDLVENASQKIVTLGPYGYLYFAAVRF
jgi:hypothetical protein